MNNASLATFLGIVETGNLNRAATRLNVTQSTVTARLNTLEDELGQTLFLRRKSGAELTAAGFRFLRYAQLITDLWRQARQETSLPADIETVFNLGCHPDLWHTCGRAWFDAVRRRAAAVAVSAWPGEQADLDRWLGSGLIDAALCYSPTLRENRRAFALYEDRLVLVSTVRRGRMRWDPDYIYVDLGEDFRRSHAEAYPDGDTPTTVFGSATWALEHILAHGGSAYLPHRLVAGSLVDGRLHRVADVPEFRRTVYLAVNKRAMQLWPWFDTVLAEHCSAAADSDA